MDEEGNYSPRLVFNSGFDFNKLKGYITRGHREDFYAGKNLSEHIIHELVHVMTGQQAKDIDEFYDFMEVVEKLFVPGVSGYSDWTKDGFETIAEAFVKIRNGEPVPEKARKLVEKYIGRWKKQ